MHTVFEKISAASYRSVILTLRRCKKARLVLSFLDFETHFSAEAIGLNLFYRSHLGMSFPFFRFICP